MIAAVVHRSAAVSYTKVGLTKRSPCAPPTMKMRPPIAAAAPCERGAGMGAISRQPWSPKNRNDRATATPFTLPPKT